MKRDEAGDLIAFLAVADAESFTRAAARLGTSQSALSHAVRRLEERLGIRLLTRTTRRVAPTRAGEELAATLRPALNSIDQQLESLVAEGARPSGQLRITATQHAAATLLMPAATALMARYPDIHIEISADARLADIVAERFDAGVRLGEQVEKDMIAVRISPDIRMSVVGSPAYLRDNPPPQTPHDLTAHACLNLRLPTLGGLYAWEFERDGRPLNVRVEGPFTCNEPDLLIAGAEAGLGLICLPRDHVTQAVEAGRLVHVLEDWCPPFPGYHIYFPSRRQTLPALRLLVDALRYRGP